ncbi:SEL1-like repeat protein [Bacteroides acidifaciens]|uniref:SEL1-like repeat protein n=1 Tax=Bacteroides acidifaciens TaxID=85831 RepID=UPI002674B017|nr:SEL1-like repeat protein [Bacteroides acidifaciens]
MKREDNEKRARDLVKKASRILRPLREKIWNSDGSIRPQLIEGLDCIEEYLRIANRLTDEFGTSFISMNVMNLTFFLSNVSKEEFQYSIDRLTEWKNVGYENCNNALAQILTCELGKDIAERRLDWTDREFVDIIVGCSATIGCGLSKLLHNPAVREYYIKKASEGDFRHTFTLGTYYYESEEYESAFNTLNNLKDDHTAKYLGLMYYYGHGTKQNHELAREYLERYYDMYCCVEPEVYWSLGDLYGRYESKIKQFDLYIKYLESPYINDNDHFIKKMRQQCMLYRRGIMKHDWMILEVEIKSDNHVCEFSLEIAPYCHLIVDWGDGTCDKQGDLDKTGSVTCHHSYSQPGTYTINIESLWEKIIEGFDFSRCPRQLHFIYLGDCTGLRKLSIVGQCLTNLDLTPGSYRKDFLTGVVCRDNELTKLDLRHCPNLTHLDCSCNPIKSIYLPQHSALSVVSRPDSLVNSSEIDESLRLNRGIHCNQINYDDLTDIDMRLEYYFRCTNWDKVRKFIRKNEREYYDHQLAECELTFVKLKELSREENHNPYEDKGGFLAVHDSYVSDDSILHHEDFFITREAWTTCLATKVRDSRRHDPWMGFPKTTPEYFVASCLVNMIKNWRELKERPHTR